LFLQILQPSPPVLQGLCQSGASTRPLSLPYFFAGWSCTYNLALFYAPTDLQS
jgi:hypothetical protein